MSVATIPTTPRLRLSRIVLAALVAVGLAVGSFAAVRAVDNDNSGTKSHAISAPVRQSFQSVAAAEYQPPAIAHSSKWSARAGLPASPAASEFPVRVSHDDTSARFGPQ
jgi:hypothetical protein